MAAGHVPYRDFRVEYPPGALPAFGIPAIGKPGFSFYNREFQILMALCGVGSLAAMASRCASSARPSSGPRRRSASSRSRRSRSAR